MNKLSKEIARKKNILDQYAPFPDDLYQKIDTLNKIEIAYNNLLMDGDQITREDAVSVLIENGYQLDKSLTTRYKIANYGDIYDFFKTKQRTFHKFKNNITLLDIQKIHGLLLKKVNNRNAGKFRDIDIRIKEAKITIPSSENIPKLMQGYVDWMSKAAREETPIQWAADAHFKLIEIMPFVDANSRVARQIMNLILMENKYPPIITKPINKKYYLNAIQEGQQTGKLENYHNMIYRLINKSLDRYLDFL